MYNEVVSLMLHKKKQSKLNGVFNFLIKIKSQLRLSIQFIIFIIDIIHPHDCNFINAMC